MLLVEAAGQAGIEVIEDRINRRGGVCRLEGRTLVIFDDKAPWSERNRLLLLALRRLDLEAVYLPPKVRALLEEHPPSRE